MTDEEMFEDIFNEEANYNFEDVVWDEDEEVITFNVEDFDYHEKREDINQYIETIYDNLLLLSKEDREKISWAIIHYLATGHNVNMANNPIGAFSVNLYRKELEKLHKTYLKRGYNKKVRSKKEKVQNQHCGIYGIYAQGELVYIGMTYSQGFEERFEQHKNSMEVGNNKLYQLLRVYNFEDIEFKILIDISKIKTNEEITRRDIQAMEIGLIQMYQPIGNTIGIDKKYSFN